MTSPKTSSSATARLIDSQASRMDDPISKLGASHLNRSFQHGSLLLFRLDAFLSNFHFASRIIIGGHHIVDGLDGITQDLLFGCGLIDRFRSLANGRFNLKAGAPPPSRSLLVNTWPIINGPHLLPSLFFFMLYHHYMSQRWINTLILIRSKLSNLVSCCLLLLLLLIFCPSRAFCESLRKHVESNVSHPSRHKNSISVTSQTA
jgi:hypothetical protein